MEEDIYGLEKDSDTEYTETNSNEETYEMPEVIKDFPEIIELESGWEINYTGADCGGYDTQLNTRTYSKLDSLLKDLGLDKETILKELK